MKKPEEIIDQHLEKLETLSTDFERIRETFQFMLIYGDTFGNKTAPLLQRNLELAKKTGDRPAEIVSLLQLSFFSGITSGYGGTVHEHNWEDVPSMIEETKPEPFMYAIAINLLSYYYWFRGEFEKGFNTIFEAIKNSEETDLGIAWHYYSLAVFYFDTKDFKNSRIYYQRAHDVFVKQNLSYGIARAANGMASVYIKQEEPEKALKLLEFANEIYRELGHPSGLSRSLNDLGLIEKANGNFENALDRFKESIDLRKELNHTQGLITTYTEIGETYLLMDNYDQALNYLKLGIELSKEIKANQKTVRLHKLFSETYKKCGNVNNALTHFEAFYDLQSKIMSDEASNNIKSLHTRFEKEKSERETEFERLKNIELKAANEVIAEKNKEILDSIKYARRIQSALITSELYIDKTLSRLNKPEPLKL